MLARRLRRRPKIKSAFGLTYRVYWDLHIEDETKDYRIVWYPRC